MLQWEGVESEREVNKKNLGRWVQGGVCDEEKFHVLNFFILLLSLPYGL